MEFMIDHPRVLSIATTVLMWLTAVLGVWLRRRFHSESADDKDSYGFVVTATLTLLGLIIGFTFSMAATRYDQRRLFEENEANAIGTEFVRLDLLPADVARMEKHLLRQYLDRRIDFYDLDYGAHFSAVEKSCAKLQNAMWQGLLAPVTGQPNAVTALAVYAVCVVESDSEYVVGPDAGDCAICKFPGGLCGEAIQAYVDDAAGAAADRGGLVLFDCGYR
jgi:hypothetical protein